MSQTKAQLVAPVGIVTASSFAVSDGTAGAPSIRFSDSSTTGIYSPGVNQFAIATAGSGRVFIDANGKIGLNAASTGAYFRALGLTGTSIIEAYGADSGGNADVEIKSNGSTGSSRLIFSDTASQSGLIKYTHSSDSLELFTAGAERLRITSAGLMGLGTSAPVGNLDVTFSNSTVYSSSNMFAGGITQYIYNSSTTDGVASTLGLAAKGSGTTAQAAISAIYSSTGVGHLAFGTRAGGNVIERMRITSTGVGIGTASPGYLLDLFGTTPALRIKANGVANGVKFEQSSATGDVELNVIDTYPLIFKNANTERCRLDTSGRLLVGTSSSSADARAIFQGSSSGGDYCHVLLARNTANPTSGSTLGNLRFTDSNHNVGAQIVGASDANWSSGSYGGRLVFSTTADGASSPTERMRIANTGSVHFNATSGDGASVVINNNIASTFGLSIYDNANSGWLARFYNNTATIAGSITRSGTTVAYNTSSDYRLKENVTIIDDGISRLQQLKPSRFNFIADPKKTVDGFIAHEVQAVVPEAIHGTKDAVDDDGNPIYQGIDQSKLVPLLTAALQEAVGRIETLEIEKELQQTVLDDLLARVVALETK